jgi:hypothetical protein
MKTDTLTLDIVVDQTGFLWFAGGKYMMILQSGEWKYQQSFIKQ